MPFSEDAIRQIIQKHGVDKCTMRIVKKELVDYDFPESYWAQHPAQLDLLKQSVVKVAEEITSSTTAPPPTPPPSLLTPTSQPTEKVQTDTSATREKKSSKPVSVKKSKKQKLSTQPPKHNPFNDPYLLSDKLSKFLGGIEECSRPQTVKKIWAHIKEFDLQDATDKRYINCDDAMRELFGVSRLHMFTMNKLLSKHFISKEEKASD